MRASRSVLAVCLLSAILLFPQSGGAQSVYGQVWGRFTAPLGAPVSAASVSVISVETGAHTSTKTDSGGYFTVSNLTPDLYQIEVQADGFKRLQGTIAVSADSTTTVNAALQAGDPNTITERSPGAGTALKLDRTDVATPFDLQSVRELPLLDRNLTRLQLLAPGAARGRLAIPQDQNPQNSIPVNINGQHFSGAAFQLDGTENRDPLEGIVVINPTLDSVREMKVTTQGYNAEFGQATAGVITVQTRSGSHAWHGDAFGYRRTGWGQSTDPFAPAGVPPGKHSLFGGSLGGPIVKNKLFIFGDYEGTRVSQGASVLLNVPTKTVRDTCVGKSGTSAVPCDLSEFAHFIQDNKLHDDKQHSSNAFPDDKIPNARITDEAVALLKLLPLPNHTSTNPSCGSGETVCDNYLTSGQEVFNGDRFNLRADYNLGSAVRLFGRYSFGEFSDTGTPAFGQSGGGTGTNPQKFAGVARTRNQGISTGFTYSIGPKLLTDFRFGYFRYRLNNDSQDFGQIPVALHGVFAPDTGDPFATGLPDIQIPGQSASSFSIPGDYVRFGYSSTVNNCNCPLREREQQFQFVNNWTRSVGEHTVKWGADLRYLQNYRLASDQRRTGSFSFAPNITGLALATFLIGDVTSFERFFSTPAAGNAGEHQRRFGFYGQDTWRINSRLTLSYGLRWEIYFPQTVNGSGRGGFLIPDLNNHDPGTTTIGVPPGTDNAGNVSNSWKNLAPRFGIAYLLNPSTVLRAGYGRSFDTGYAGDIFGIAATQNPPVTVDQNIQSGGFNLSSMNAPPRFIFPSKSPVSLLDLASANLGDPNQSPVLPPSGAVLYALPPQIRVPTVDSWNLTVQHELSSHMYFELAYVGNKGTHVFTDSGAGTYYDLNQTTLEGDIMHIVNKDETKCRQGAVFKVGNADTYCLIQAQYRGFYNRVEAVPDTCPKTSPCFFNPTLFPVRYFGNNAGDNYHSLQARLQRSFSRGYSFLAHYTWSKGFDYDSNYFRVDPRVGYGPASFDITHRFVMTNIWDLPIGRGKAWLGGISPVANRFVGGWMLSAITIWQSGLPFTPSYRANLCGFDADTKAPCRPNRVGLVNISGNREQYFTTTAGVALPGNDCIPDPTDPKKLTNVCGVDPMTGQSVPGPASGPWQRPGAGQIGNAGRNSLRGPSFFQSDLALAKSIAITERSTLRFRVDAFNAFNKVNLGNPNSCVDCATGGSIGSLVTGAVQRTLQFSVNFEF